MNLANKLTILRIIMVPVFMAFLMLLDPSNPNTAYVTISLVLFIAASLTDTLDGYIARHYNMITDFGKFMDPLADKMLTTAAFLGLMSFGRASAWAVMLILTREFIVAGIRQVAAGGGKVIAASIWGKMKTVFQMVAIVAAIILLYPICPEPTAVLITDILVWLSAAVTVISGADYVIKNIAIIKEAK
ncbi:MAG: CDP-diacylglycerol--glycerol-3-phosphate 3-phosphatidyltransferase [Clostridia bacterium]|nr:CDP-diacylglycerol--glycerol-3-phosphate 3-phosphatidyltransferase [Clostridia bacterium]